MERVWGPVNGFYFAAYAAPAGEGERFGSYVKVCWTEPESYWEADCAYKYFGGDHHASADHALAAAARVARNATAELPPQARTLAERRQVTHEPIPRLLASFLFRHRPAPL